MYCDINVLLEPGLVASPMQEFMFYSRSVINYRLFINMNLARNLLFELLTRVFSHMTAVRQPYNPHVDNNCQSM